jgi:hypothetical protein
LDEKFISNRREVRKFNELWVINWFIDGTFKPKVWVTRSEFLKILLNSHCYEYKQEKVTSLKYIDVDKNSWQARVIQKSENLKLISGDTNINDESVFRPNDIITKLEALKIIINLSTIQPQKTVATQYDDIKILWQKKYVEIAETLLIYNADSDKNVFNVNSSVSREDMIHLLDRFIELYK